MVDPTTPAAGTGGAAERESAFKKWITVLREDVIELDYGYEPGEFTVYPEHWRTMFDGGLTPDQAFKRALDAHAEGQREEDEAKKANWARIQREDAELRAEKAPHLAAPASDTPSHRSVAPELPAGSGGSPATERDAGGAEPEAGRVDVGVVREALSPREIAQEIVLDVLADEHQDRVSTFVNYRGEIDRAEGLIRAALDRTGDGWRPIGEARKDRTAYLLKLKNPIPAQGREDLRRWDGISFVGRHPGLADDGFDLGWQFAAPVGQGGFPDEWFEGFRELPPSTSQVQP